MEVTRVSQANYSGTSLKLSQTNSDEHFKSLLAQNAPNELSFSEYKTFSNEDIDRLYPINLMPEANKQAKLLLVKVNMTNDENLNKILFDKELLSYQSIYKDYFKVANTTLNSMFAAECSFAYSSSSLEAMNKHFENLAVNNKGESVEEYTFDFTKTIQITIDDIQIDLYFEKSIGYTPQHGLSSQDLFLGLDSINNQLNVILNQHHFEKNSHFYTGVEVITSYYKDIKQEYQTKIDDNNLILSSYTKNTKPNILDTTEHVSENIAKSGDTHEKILFQKESLENIVKDILSVLRAGYTQSELENIEKLLSQIQKLYQEQKDGKPINDTEIDKKIKELEELLVALEKRKAGQVVDKSYNTNNHNGALFETKIEQIRELFNETYRNRNI